MKLLMLSCFGIANYGSALLTFATQKKMEEYFDEIETIHAPHYYRYRDIIKTQKSPFKIVNSTIVQMIFKRRYKHGLKCFSVEDGRFVHSDEELKLLNPQADVYCTGSDQIWNVDFLESVLGARFLSFAPKGARKFAYSSSFGKDSLEKSKVEQTKGWVSEFEKISVREDTGLKILQEQYNYQNAIQLVDPTLAMPPDFWRKYASKRKVKEDYILVYMLSRNKAADDYVQKISSKTGLPIVRLCHNLNQTRSNGKKMLFPTIPDFLSLFDNAKYVFTDSFHGVAFSLNLNSSPIVILPEKYTGRLTSILRLVNEENRIVTSFDNFEILNHNVDFNHVNTILAKERERVDEFLKEMVEKAKS